MVYYNPYIIGYYNPLYTPNNQGIVHCSVAFDQSVLKFIYQLSLSYINFDRRITQLESPKRNELID